jgi:hypothetical protein
MLANGSLFASIMGRMRSIGPVFGDRDRGFDGLAMTIFVIKPDLPTVQTSSKMIFRPGLKTVKTVSQMCES